MAANKCTRERECLRCGALHGRYKFCSASCEQHARREAKQQARLDLLSPCEVCGEKVSFTGARACSSRCRELLNQSRKKAKRDAARMAITALPRTCACCESEKPGERFKSATAVYCLDCVPAGLTEDQTTHRVRWLRNGGPQRQAEQERAKAERERTRTLDAAQRLLGRIIGRQVREAKKGIAARRKERMRIFDPTTASERADYRSPAQQVRDIEKWRRKNLKKLGRALVSDGTVEHHHITGAKSCLYCGAELNRSNRTVDHMDPLILGGIHSAANIAQCCRTCNSRKAGMSFSDWLGRIKPEFARKAAEFYESAKALGSKAEGSCRPVSATAGEMAAYIPSFSALWAAAPDGREGARRKGAG